MADYTLFTSVTREDVIKCIARGDDINMRGIGGDTPFIFHCKANNSEVVLALIENSCDVTLQNNSFQNGLNCVCVNDNIFLLRLILQDENVQSLINIPNQSEPPLLYACINNSNDIFDILIEYGADVNIVPLDGTTPLVRACENGHIDIVDKLLSLGANVNIRDSFGRTAIYYADENIIHKLFLYGSDFNIRDFDGDTPLIYMIKNFYYDSIITTLLHYKIDLNVRNDQGETALINAIIFSNDLLVKELLDFGADINITDNNGKTAYDYAVESYNRSISQHREYPELFDELDNEKIILDLLTNRHILD